MIPHTDFERRLDLIGARHIENAGIMFLVKSIDILVKQRNQLITRFSKTQGEARDLVLCHDRELNELAEVK